MLNHLSTSQQLIQTIIRSLGSEFVLFFFFFGGGGCFCLCFYTLFHVVNLFMLGKTDDFLNGMRIVCLPIFLHQIFYCISLESEKSMDQLMPLHHISYITCFILKPILFKHLQIFAESNRDFLNNL